MAPVPTLEQRLAARTPSGAPVMFQRWENLLFLHWRYDPDVLAARLPPGLHLDLHDGAAYAGIVPFFMSGVRPRFLPCFPGLSRFQELNLRTYVHDDDGIPGVWFFSLDAASRVAVAVARRLFHLPYRHAGMSARIDGQVDYRCAIPGGPDLHYRYALPADGPEAAPGSLEFFLLERYHLYAHNPATGALYRGQVHHAPYRFSPATVDHYDAALFDSNDLAPPDAPPCHLVAAPGFPVTIFPLRRITPK
ncbi:MAG: DUF2071 domain-containing protein [Akkermansiaceae bacterium]|nr:DUF2071 domain-containing protein [Akkermansiaceae bacterium]